VLKTLAWRMLLHVIRALQELLTLWECYSSRWRLGYTAEDIECTKPPSCTQTRCELHHPRSINVCFVLIIRPTVWNDKRYNPSGPLSWVALIQAKILEWLHQNHPKVAMEMFHETAGYEKLESEKPPSFSVVAESGKSGMLDPTDRREE